MQGGTKKRNYDFGISKQFQRRWWWQYGHWGRQIVENSITIYNSDFIC